MEEMIKLYLGLTLSRTRTMNLRWSQNKKRLLVDAYPGFQSVTQTHQL